MPSACCICKRVKQINENVSFHKFPFSNQKLLAKWMEFVQKVSKGNRITKFSSICSNHFPPEEILSHGLKDSRKSLRRDAVPSIFHQNPLPMPVQDDPEPVIFVDEHYELCGLCRTLSKERLLILIDENCFAVMRKCLPFVNFNLSLMQKICCDCSDILNTFSAFIDRVTMAQNVLNQDVPRIRQIKLEPMAENDQQRSHQKKCEILEIVDIKPFNFHPYESNALNCEEFEDEIQILSPKELKVEINDDDMDGIRNYVGFIHDHNYIKNFQVKTEFDEEQVAVPASTVKICCRKKFKSFRRFLQHKIVKHSSGSKQCCLVCKKSFASRKRLEFHKRFYCRKNLKIDYKKVLESRLKKSPKNPLLNPKRTEYKCKVCGKVFKGSKNLYQHKSATHRAAKFACKICGKIFKMKHGLRQHIKSIHEKQKLFSCPVCMHSFALKADVKRCRHSALKRNQKGCENQRLFLRAPREK